MEDIVRALARFPFFVMLAGAALVGCDGNGASFQGTGGFLDGQAAALVVGQRDFTSTSAMAGESSVNDHGFSAPRGVWVQDGMLWVADTGANRVLRFDNLPTSNGASATLALGQPDLATDSGPGVGVNRLNGPAAVASDGTRLAVADALNNRVLLWSVPPLANATGADQVVGQIDFFGAAPACTGGGLSGPLSVALTATRLIVADTLHHRILIWNTPLVSNGQTADLVLGQSDFVSCVENRDASVDADTLHTPSGVWSDGTRLIVADSGNRRVLIWNGFPQSAGEAADIVLGQSDFTTAAEGVGAGGMAYPYGVHYDGQRLFVSDVDNHRVLIWNQLPGADDTPADHVLGQSDFERNTAGGGAAGLSNPTGVFSFGNQLFVADRLNHRVLVYERQ